MKISCKLQNLLQINDPLFEVNLNSLEKYSGHSGIDTKLVGDIIEKSYTVMRQLKLDPNDTTGEELYLTLNNCFNENKATKFLTQKSYVLISINNQLVSFNFNDIARNTFYHRKYADRRFDQAQSFLKYELINRYLQTNLIDQNKIEQIASEMHIKYPNKLVSLSHKIKIN